MTVVPVLRPLAPGVCGLCLLLVLVGCASRPLSEEEALLTSSQEVESARRDVDRRLRDLEKRGKDLLEAEERQSKAKRRLEEAREAFEEAKQEREQALERRGEAERELRSAERRLQERQLDLTRNATDSALFRLVQRRLLEDKQLRHVAVSAQVSQGVVFLKGSVPDEVTRDRALQVVGGLPGVRDVESQLSVAGGGLLDWRPR